MMNRLTRTVLIPIAYLYQSLRAIFFFFLSDAHTLLLIRQWQQRYPQLSLSYREQFFLALTCELLVPASGSSLTLTEESPPHSVLSLWKKSLLALSDASHPFLVLWIADFAYSRGFSGLFFQLLTSSHPRLLPYLFQSSLLPNPPPLPFSRFHFFRWLSQENLDESPILPSDVSMSDVVQRLQSLGYFKNFFQCSYTPLEPSSPPSASFLSHDPLFLQSLLVPHELSPHSLSAAHSSLLSTSECFLRFFHHLETSLAKLPASLSWFILQSLQQPLTAPIVPSFLFRFSTLSRQYPLYLLSSGIDSESFASHLLSQPSLAPLRFSFPLVSFYAPYSSTHYVSRHPTLDDSEHTSHLFEVPLLSFCLLHLFSRYPETTFSPTSIPLHYDLTADEVWIEQHLPLLTSYPLTPPALLAMLDYILLRYRSMSHPPFSSPPRTALRL